MSNTATDVHSRAWRCLMLEDIDAKQRCVHELYDSRSAGLELADAGVIERVEVPGRPRQPELVSPMRVPKRGFRSEAGRLRLVHSIAHIEFNAINLALDAVYRFRGMPEGYYLDWLRVAAEEARHFSLLQGYLRDRGSYYGQYTAHNGLWEMALKTDHDVMVRMALVPRVLEARGLDVTPAMMARLGEAGDAELVSLLEIIFRDEIGHVRIGSRWFGWCCERRGLDPTDTFIGLLQEYLDASVTGPLELEARREAGFTEDEIERLCEICR